MRSDASGIAGWVKNSFIDFPGTVSTVLFFSGCNLRCPYCHNPRLIDAGSAESESIPLTTILDFLEKRRKFIQGVVLSGGEPTLNQSVPGIGSAIRAAGFRVKLDTNGLLPEKISEIKPDYLALDIKTTSPNYVRLLKAPYEDTAQRLENSIRIAKSMDENAEIRITIAPEIITMRIIEEIGSMLRGIAKVYLQPMRCRNEVLDPTIQDKKMPTTEELEAYKKTLLRFVDFCEIR